MIRAVITNQVEGTWSIGNLIGASCHIVSERMEHKRLQWNDVSEEHLIEDIKFRVSSDGKIVPIFKLSGIDSQYYTANNLCIEGIKQNIN